jgi:Domain of unknown function (DUF4381)
MSAPPLPDVFGNYALGDFVEVVAPGPVSWWPQTVGWLCLGLLLAVFASLFAWRKLRHWHANRYRREAALEIRKLAAGEHTEPLLAELNRLLKRVALAAYPRDEVAMLSGLPWAEFLSRQCDIPSFDDSQLELLASGGYRQLEIDGELASELMDAAMLWIESHRGASNV